MKFVGELLGWYGIKSWFVTIKVCKIFDNICMGTIQKISDTKFTYTLATGGIKSIMAGNCMQKNPSISNRRTKAANDIKRWCICHKSKSWDTPIRGLQPNNTTKRCWLPHTSTSITSQWHHTLPGRHSCSRASRWPSGHPRNVPWVCSHLMNEQMHHLSKPTPVTSGKHKETNFQNPTLLDFY